MKKQVIIWHNLKENGWYSTVLALLLVGFMIIITTGIFNLVMTEMKDTKGMTHYLQAYAWAEAGIELAMLDIKTNAWLVDVNKWDPKSKILDYKTDVIYNFDWYTWEINKTWIWPWDYALVELLSAKNPTLKATSTSTWTSQPIMWNIVWEESWITWKWSSFYPHTDWKHKVLNSSKDFIFSTKTVNNFLSTSVWNYLIVYNPNLFSIDINLKVASSEKIAKNNIGVKSSGISWNYKQNLVLDIDKSWYLNFLKYSIFSL